MLDFVWLIPALPLAGFLVVLLFGRKLGDPRSGYFATLMVAASFAVTVGVYLDLMYVDQWSPLLDLVIMARTAKTIIRPEGAY